jgi:hypothetical protein
VHSFRVKVIGKTEGMSGLQPTMVGVSSCFRFVQNGFHNLDSLNVGFQICYDHDEIHAIILNN